MFNFKSKKKPVLDFSGISKPEEYLGPDYAMRVTYIKGGGNGVIEFVVTGNHPKFTEWNGLLYFYENDYSIVRVIQKDSFVSVVYEKVI